MSNKNSQIIIDVNTDENHVPLKINWTATDSGVENQRSKAMILSMWDETQNSALRIDLWDKDMKVDEMKLFVHQTLVTMADSFERATGEKQMTLAMKDFCDYFAEKMKLYES